MYNIIIIIIHGCSTSIQHRLDYKIIPSNNIKNERRRSSSIINFILSASAVSNYYINYFIIFYTEQPNSISSVCYNTVGGYPRYNTLIPVGGVSHHSRSKKRRRMNDRRTTTKKGRRKKKKEERRKKKKKKKKKEEEKKR